MSAAPIRDAWDDLDDDLALGDLAEIPEQVDAVLADRMLRRVLRERRLLRADEEVAAAQIAQVEAWLERRRAAHDTSYLEGCLQQFHQARLADDPKAKTIHLPSGTLTARKQPDRWDIDPDGFIPWAKQHRPDLLRRKVEIDRPAVKATLINTDDGRVLDMDSGEFITSVTVTPGDIAYHVKEDDQ